MTAQLSYDLVMEDDMSFVEGTYRLPGRDWEVFIFRKSDIYLPEIKFGKWSSGVSGITVKLPRAAKLNASTVDEILKKELQVDEWVVVRGPDSMVLR